MPTYVTAVILAAGKGVRLDQPGHPKPLVHIGHKPLLLWTIERLQDAGVQTIWIVSGSYTSLYQKELSGHPAIRADIRYLETETSGGDMLDSITALPQEVKGPYILTVSDIISEKNLYAALDTGDTGVSGDVISIVGTHATQNERSGAHHRVHVIDGRVLPAGPSTDANGMEIGIYAISGDGGTFFSSLRERQPEIQTFEHAMEALAREGLVRARSIEDGEWYDVNTPGTLVRAEMFVREAVYQGPRTDVRVASSLVSPIVDAVFMRDKHLESKIVIRRGLLQEVGRLNLLEPSRWSSPHFLLTDSNVDPLYGDLVLRGLREAGYQVVKLVMPAGEHEKTFENYLDLSGKIFAHGMDEGSVIFDVGGGVVNNMAGFLASTLYRGVELIHVPTSTMAQVDAAIDFKQAVNSNKGKNLIGSYHSASHILIDPETIRTLDVRHIRNGLAESIKHALVQDATFFDFFMRNERSIADIDFWEEVIRRTIALKVPLLNGKQVGANEMGPQYGHCIGHAVEHLSGYSFLHGEAVAIGMCVSAEIAKMIGACDDETVEAHYRICEKYQLPTNVPASIPIDDVLNAIRYDKHYLGKLPRMGLPASIGVLWEDRGDVAIPIDYAIIAKAIEANQRRQSVDRL